MKKKLFVAAICVCLAAVLACGSLAYFTSTSSSTNKFMTAAYDPQDPITDPDDVFSVEVVETAEKDNNNPKSVGGTPNQNGGFDYENLLPGSEASKNVKVKNTGEYSEFVRVKITFDKVNAWKAILGDKNLAAELCNIDTANWQLAKTVADTTNDKVTYIYNYSKSGVGTKLAEDASTTSLFTKVTIPASIDAEEFVTVDGFTVNVIAEAIQSDYTGTIAEAFTAFEEQNK